MTDPVVREFLERKLKELPDGNAQLPSALSSLFVAGYGHRFQQCLDDAARAGGKSLWVEKTPQHLHRIPQILRSVENARFVHVLRSGRDAIASLFKVTSEYPDRWGGSRTIEDCASRWITDVSISADYVGDRRHHMLVYDELVADPEAVTRDLCEFVGLPFDAVMISDSGDAYWSSVAEADAAWTANAGRPVSSGTAGGKFASYLDSAQQRVVDAMLATSGLADIDDLVT